MVYLPTFSPLNVAMFHLMYVNNPKNIHTWILAGTVKHGSHGHIYIYICLKKEIDS